MGRPAGADDEACGFPLGGLLTGCCHADQQVGHQAALVVGHGQGEAALLACQIAAGQGFWRVNQGDSQPAVQPKGAVVRQPDAGGVHLGCGFCLFFFLFVFVFVVFVHFYADAALHHRGLVPKGEGALRRARAGLTQPFNLVVQLHLGGRLPIQREHQVQGAALFHWLGNPFRQAQAHNRLVARLVPDQDPDRLACVIAEHWQQRRLDSATGVGGSFILAGRQREAEGAHARRNAEGDGAQVGAGEVVALLADDHLAAQGFIDERV